MPLLSLPILWPQIVDEHIHRVYVVDSDEEPRVQAVITPTDILRWVGGQHTSAPLGWLP